MDGQALSALLSAIATFAIGLSVALRQRMQRPVRQFVWLCINLCTWHIVNAVFVTWTPENAQREVPNPALLVAALLPVTSVRFFRAFLNVEPRKISASRVLYFVATAFVLVLGYAMLFPKRGIHQLINLPFVVYILAGLSLSIFEIYSAWRRTLSRMEKTRIFYLLVGAAISVGFAAGTFVFPVIGNVLITMYVYFLSQILLRYRLLDLNEILGRMAVLAVFAVVVSAIFQVIFLIPTRVGDERSNLLLTFVASCVLAVLFEPLWTKIELEVNRWLFREKWELRRRIDELRLSLANVIDVREAVRVVMESFEESRRVTHVAIYLADQDGSGYELAGHLGPRPVERVDAAARRPFFERLASQKAGATLSLEQLELEHARLRADDTGIETVDAIARTLDEMHAGLVIAITAGDQLLGLLCLKDERIRDAYGTDEIDLFRALAAQMGITLQNSKLYERMKERDRLAVLGEMAAGLAHEIRNPLGAIKGAAQFLAPPATAPGLGPGPGPGPGPAMTAGGADEEAGAMPPESREFLHIIVEEANRLNKVVSQFLDYARPFRGELTALELNDVVRKSAQLIKSDSKVEIQVSLDESNPRVRADPEQLRQVFLNLAINAIEAMPEGGKLIISTGLRRIVSRGGASRSSGPEAKRVQEKYAELRFRDTGPGIPPAVIKNLFIPFFTTKEKGTGLGLPISQRIIENHGGRIEVRSRLGGGSTFTVVLPWLEKEDEVERGSVENMPTPHGRWARIQTPH